MVHCSRSWSHTLAKFSQPRLMTTVDVLHQLLWRNATLYGMRLMEVPSARDWKLCLVIVDFTREPKTTTFPAVSQLVVVLATRASTSTHDGP